MRKLLVFFTGMMLFFLQQGHGQQKQVWLEDFDGGVPPLQWTATQGWEPNTLYYLPGSGLNPLSYRGRVPTITGDSIVLTTPSYDCGPFQYVFLRFSHICKVSPLDVTRIEYRTDGQGAWRTLLNPQHNNRYLGFAANYGITGFNASTYPEWEVGDSTVLPTQSWWKTETFDMTPGTGWSRVEFRFVIKRGNQAGTSVSYGWLIENVEVIAADYDIYPPDVQLVSPFVRDSVYSTGPWEINAKVKTNTAAAIQTPILKWTANGITDSIPMTHVRGDSLWKANVPQFAVGTVVTYTVIGRDMFGNESMASSFYIIRMPAPSQSGYVIIGTGTGTNSQNPYYYNYNHSYTRNYYMSYEIDPNRAGGVISSIAFNSSTTSSVTRISFYLKATRDSINTSTAYIDPIADGATLVWGEAVAASSVPGWITFTLHTPFYLPPNMNLLVYCDNKNGNYQSQTAANFYYTTQTKNTSLYAYYDGTAFYPPTVAVNSTLGTSRPNLRLYKTGGPVYNNSVAITHVITPDLYPVQGGVPTPVKVNIRNKGFNDLDSCLINYRINGGPALLVPYKWTGNLLWDFEDNPIIGQYTPKMGGYDTIVAWVSMPNGVQDSLTSDDTVTNIVYGCPGAMQGDYTVGAGKTFPNLEMAIKTLSDCGVGGDVRFLIASGTYTDQWNFVNNAWNSVNYGDIMGQYILTFASETGNRNDVIIQPPSGVVVSIDNSNNFRLESLTFKTTTNYCVQFKGTNTPLTVSHNITIRDCNLLCDTTSTGGYPLYKGSSTGLIDSIFIINCLLDGGAYNVYLYGISTAAPSPGTANGYNTDIVIDSCILRNPYNYNLYFCYTSFESISYNKILSRATGSMSTNWYGIQMANYGNIEKRFVGNSIIQRNYTTITTPYAVYLYPYFNYYNVTLKNRNGALLMANNEIILYNTNGTGYQGFYFYLPGGNGMNVATHILHNSIYIGGSNTSHGIYFSGTTAGMYFVVKKNNIYVASSSGYPIYVPSFNATYYDIDSNNLYSPNYVGYANSAHSTISAWQGIVTTDKTSTKINPSYIQVGTYLKDHLELSNYNSFLCQLDPRVSTDIRGTQRGGITSWGCYTNIGTPYDGALGNIVDGMSGGAPGGTGTLKVELSNAGGLPIDTVDFCWEINGVSQPQSRWIGGPIAPGGTEVVTVGTFTYIAGTNTAEVRICGLGSKTDGNPLNDTAKASTHVCASALPSPINIPGDFADLNAFATFVDTCPMAPGTVLNFNYNGTVDFSAVAMQLNDLPLVITGNITASSGNAVILGFNKNLTFRDANITSSSGYCIQFVTGCTNIVVRNCNLLASPTTTSTANACIYKAGSTGFLKDITIANNKLDGGYYNILLYSGTGAGTLPYDNNVVIDSNICTNSYGAGIYLYYGGVEVTNNDISCRYNSPSTNWYGIFEYYTTGKHISWNRILLQSNNTMTGAMGIGSTYRNYYAATGVSYIANNEIRYMGNNYSTQGAIYSQYAGAQNTATLLHIVHNSIYMEGMGISTSTPKGIYYTSFTGNYHTFKQNNICIASPYGYPIYVNGGTYNPAQHDIDANNLYAPVYVGYLNGDHTTISSWQSVVTSDRSSVSVQPSFINTDSNLKMDNYSPIFCSMYPGVLDDITGYPRQTTTAMGCYTPLISNLDLLNAEITCSDRVLGNELVTVKVRVVSQGATPISSATFGWSRNGVIQASSMLRNFTPILSTMGVAEVTIDTFSVQNQTEDIVVWIDQVEGQKDDDIHNDTARLTFNIVPLVEFVPPTPNDTITYRNFNVCAKIHTGSGAPTSPPQLQVTTIISGNYTLHNTLPMSLVNGVWTTSLANQYYGSKIIYSLSVSDTRGNNQTIIDSVFVHYAEKGDTVIVGTGTSGSTYFPATYNYLYSWARSIYLNAEICPDIGTQTNGTYITKIAFQMSTNVTTNTYQNQECYLRATAAVANTSSSYLDPAAAGATLVFNGSWTPAYPWGEITLNTPFFLPPGMNLEIFWNNNNSVLASPITWMGTSMSMGTVMCWEQSGGGWTSAIGCSSNTSVRCNVRFITVMPFQPYNGYDLALTSVTAPFNDGGLCERDYSAVRVNLANYGENDYDFSKDNVDIGYEVIDPIGTVYKGSVPLRSGSFLSQQERIVELMPVMQMPYGGTYAIKAWVISPLDNVIYDDTVALNYVSRKIGIPIDEYFGSTDMPYEFMSSTVVGMTDWSTYQPSGFDPVQPNTPPGVLRFAGTVGSMSTLSTRQVDLYGAINPKMDFWYYHDAMASDDDDTYTDVVIIADGVPYIELTLLKRDGNGWTQYTVDLSPYTSARCVLIEFQSMNIDRAGAASEQFIDRIYIASEFDLAVEEIIVDPEITASSTCDLNNRAVVVVIRATMSQNVDFSTHPTNLRVEIPGRPAIDYPLVTGILQGYMSMTIPIATGVTIPKGTNKIRAYLTVPIDNLNLNDTAEYILDVNPTITLTADPVSGNGNCPPNGSSISQNATVKNTGNMNISQVEVIFRLTAGNYTDVMQETVYNLYPNDSAIVTFNYVVPGMAGYDIEIIAYITCDSVLANDKISFTECVEINDVALTTFIQPQYGIKDRVGEGKDLEIQLINMSKSIDYTDVKIYAQIEGQALTILEDIIPVIYYSDTVLFAFKDKYLVPDVKNSYFIKVFIESVDNIPNNDTLLMERLIDTTGVGITNSNGVFNFTLGQNIPNPANNNTIIDYSVPAEGEVIFKVHSMNGQLLYARTIQSEAGKQFIELNTNGLAAGVYLYSLEYKGQKLVKRMSVKN